MPTPTEHASPLPGDRRARPPIPAPVARLLEPAYRAEVARRNKRYDRGLNVRRADIPVVSVGNLSVGGTGKTPFVSLVVETLKELGHTPGIALRGYKATKHQQSDELLEHQQRLPNTPVRADPERFDAVQRLAREDHTTIAVLDDGFQHRRLHRDLDIVLLDATRSPFDDRCLPAGWLREPPSALERADLIAVTHSEAADDSTLSTITQRTREHAPQAKIITTQHAWRHLADANGEVRNIATLRNTPVTVALAIGHPAAFIAIARSNDAEIRHTVVKHDHHPWTRSETTELLRTLTASGVLLTSHKDMVKITPHVPEDSRQRVVAPRLDIVPVPDTGALRSVLGALPNL